MQHLFYDEAPYDILYYDANLLAYRNDKFAGWQNHAAPTAPRCSRYGPLGYTLLTDATARARRPSRRPPSGTAAVRRRPAAPTAAHAGPVGGPPARRGGGSNTALILGRDRRGRRSSPAGS